ncbi:unnamed protein product [Paramecium primaurelia]|uniref:Uncharacterized protein n=1 Tax=Paramecium primaurelia TaxID=5886 RepID=A0A8S1LYU2_PARPR|nr:unnamed protein product [Paramecium primaurelia]
MIVTNEEIMESFLRENAIQNLADKLKRENEASSFKQVVETIQDSFTLKGQSKQKYFAMKKQLFINSIIKVKNLLDIFEELAFCDKQNPYKQRGLKIFGVYEGNAFHIGEQNMLLIRKVIQRYLRDFLKSQGFKQKIELQLFELTEEQREKLKSYSMPTEQQKQKINMNDLSKEELNKMYQEMFTQTNELVESLEQNLKGEDQATEIMDQLMENACNDAEKIKLNLDLLQAKQNQLGEGQRKQVGYRLKIITTLIEANKNMRELGFTNENYQNFRYEVLLATREITGSEKPKPPANYAKPTQQQPQQQVNTQPDQRFQQQQIPKPPQYSEKRQPPTQQYPIRKEPEIQKQIQQPTYQPPLQQTQQYSRAPQPQKQQQTKYQNQPQQQPERYLQPAPVPPSFKKLPINKSHEHFQSPNKGQFEDQFDNRSQSSQFSGKDFYMKGQLGLITKSYEGQFIPYDDRNFSIFEEIYNHKGLNRIKRANLRKRYSIFESPEIQIGFDSNLVYHEITNRYYLRIRLCFGNKTQQILQNFQISFEGDSCMGLWTQDPIHQQSQIVQKDQQGRMILYPNKQLYVPICLNYNRVPYQIISGTFSYEMEDEAKMSHFIVPCLLTKFMNFRDTTIDSFKARWEYKSKSILKTEQLLLNRQIIKSKDDLIISFGANNVLILGGEDTQMNELDKEMVGAEYGLAFTLSSPQIEFLLKIIIFPNQTVIFQIIPYSSYQTQAEAFLNTLVFIFCQPD